MYPVLFRIGPVEITTFGVMAAVGVLAGLWLLQRELAHRGLPAAIGEAAVAAVVGGLVGAKLLYVVEHLGEASAGELLTSRGGMSWFGGVAGGVLVGLAVVAWRKWPLVPALAAAAPALALGQMFGRIGCFLVGDDYGKATDLPWGIAFPEGLPPTPVPVHPTQLYEAAFLALLTVLLVRWRRHGVADHAVLGRYLLLAGAARFAIELVRVNPTIALGMTVAQWASLLLVAGGGALLLAAPHAARPEGSEAVG